MKNVLIYVPFLIAVSNAYVYQNYNVPGMVDDLGVIGFDYMGVGMCAPQSTIGGYFREVDTNSISDVALWSCIEQCNQMEECEGSMSHIHGYCKWWPYGIPGLGTTQLDNDSSQSINELACYVKQPKLLTYKNAMPNTKRCSATVLDNLCLATDGSTETRTYHDCQLACDARGDCNGYSFQSYGALFSGEYKFCCYLYATWHPDGVHWLEEGEMNSVGCMQKFPPPPTIVSFFDSDGNWKPDGTTIVVTATQKGSVNMIEESNPEAADPGFLTMASYSIYTRLDNSATRMCMWNPDSASTGGPGVLKSATNVGDQVLYPFTDAGWSDGYTVTQTFVIEADSVIYSIGDANFTLPKTRGDDFFNWRAGSAIGGWIVFPTREQMLLRPGYTLHRNIWIAANMEVSVVETTLNMNNLFYCNDKDGAGAYHVALAEPLGGYTGAEPSIGSQGELDWINFCEAACVQEVINQNIPSGTPLCCKSYTYAYNHRTCVLVTSPGSTKTYGAAGWGGSFMIPAEDTPQPSPSPTPSPTNLPTSSPTESPTPSPTPPTPSPTPSPTNLPTIHASLQCAGNSYWNAGSGQCVVITQCGVEEYELQAPTTLSDRICVSRSTCESTTYISFVGTYNSDRTCTARTQCGANEYETSTGNAHTDRECTTHTTCMSSQYESVSPSPTFDRVCLNAKQCTVAEYESIALTENSDRVCSPATVCTYSQYETIPLTTKADRVCATLTTCTTGWYVSLLETSTSDRVCSALRVCSIDEFESVPGTNLVNRVCTPLKTCNGIEYESIAPTVSSDRICTQYVSCTSSQYEDSPPSSTSDRICRELTLCQSSLDQCEGQMPSATSDRRCIQANCTSTQSPGAGECTCMPDQFTSRRRLLQTQHWNLCNSEQFLSSGDPYDPDINNRPVCSPILPSCANGTFESAAPTINSDRACTLLTTCDTSQFESSPPQPSMNPTIDRVCTSITVCSSEQYETQAVSLVQDRICVNLTPVCSTQDPVKFESISASSVSDRICTNFTMCVDDGSEFESSAPGETFDRSCSLAQKCLASSGFFLSTAANLIQTGNDAVCDVLSICNVSQYESVAATLTSNRQCSDLSICSPVETIDYTDTALLHGLLQSGGTYQSSPSSLTQDRICTPYTRCTQQQYQVQDIGINSDRICQSLRVCDTLTEYERDIETRFTDRICALQTICAEWQYRFAVATATQDVDCRPLTICASFEYSIISNTLTTDRTCSPHTITSCDSGKGFMTGNATSDGYCVDCSSTEFSDGTTPCSPHVLTQCPLGNVLIPGTIHVDASCAPIQCDNGQHVRNHVCMLCPDGFYSILQPFATIGNSNCELCLPGRGGFGCAPCLSTSANPTTVNIGTHCNKHTCVSGEGVTLNGDACEACTGSYSSSDNEQHCSLYSHLTSNCHSSRLIVGTSAIIDNSACTSCPTDKYALSDRFACTNPPSFDILGPSKSNIELPIEDVTIYYERSVDPIVDGHILRTTVEVPYFAVGNRDVLNIVSISETGCINPFHYVDNFNSWPVCSTISAPDENNWDAFRNMIFQDTMPSTFNSTHLVDNAWERYPVPTTTVNGWDVITTAGTGDNIIYSMDVNIGSLKDSCKITPSLLGTNDNYAVKLSTTSFYEDDNGELVMSCGEQDIEVNANRNTEAVASFTTQFGIVGSIQKVKYESCTLCDPNIGPQHDCGIDNRVLRRLAVTINLYGLSPGVFIQSITENPNNCYGFGASDTVIDNSNHSIVVRSKCLNMAYVEDSDALILCDAFKTCHNPTKSANDYSFVINIAKENEQSNAVVMRASIEWTQCPTYSKQVRSIQMQSQITFYKGQSDGSGILNPSREYSTAEQVMLALSLPQGSDSGAHNLRLKQIVACLLDPEVDEYQAKLKGITTGDFGDMLDPNAFANHPMGCTRDSWPQVTGNPIITQYLLLQEHSLQVDPLMYSSARCKTSIPSTSTGGIDDGEDACEVDKCSWNVTNALDSNTWDAFKISSGPFLRSNGASWIFDVTADVEFCDVANQNGARRRLLRTVLPLDEPRTIRLQSDDKHADAATMRQLFFVLSKTHSSGSLFSEDTYTHAHKSNEDSHFLFYSAGCGGVILLFVFLFLYCNVCTSLLENEYHYLNNGTLARSYSCTTVHDLRSKVELRRMRKERFRL